MDDPPLLSAGPSCEGASEPRNAITVSVGDVDWLFRTRARALGSATEPLLRSVARQAETPSRDTPLSRDYTLDSGQVQRDGAGSRFSETTMRSREPYVPPREFEEPEQEVGYLLSRHLYRRAATEDEFTKSDTSGRDPVSR